MKFKFQILIFFIILDIKKEKINLIYFFINSKIITQYTIYKTHTI